MSAVTHKPISIHGSAPQNPGYVVVEGPVGVGKTSLAEKLAQTYGSDLLLEMPQENPFLERFYQARKQFALPTQLFFLFQRARQLQELKQGDMFKPIRVADFLLEKDSLFARLNLDNDEWRLYEQVYAQLSLDIPKPDLVIYLQAPVEVLLERVRKRGIAYERAVDRSYLQSVVESYMRFFYHYTAAPLLIVNAAEVNFVENAGDFQNLLEHLHTVRSGRHFFNPLPMSP